MTRTDIINALIKRNGYVRYLEIGVYKPKRNFDKIRCGYKVGVDPKPRGWAKDGTMHQMTSDEFFKHTLDSWDIIFIDGLHEYEQALRDVEHSLNHLTDNGTIVMHDCNPPTEERQRKVRGTGSVPWSGTVWKAFAWLRMHRKDLAMFVVDTDNGVGLIQQGEQEPFPVAPLVWPTLETHRRALLNLISKQEFQKRYVD